MLTTARRKHWHSHETYKRASDFSVVRTFKNLLFFTDSLLIMLTIFPAFSTRMEGLLVHRNPPGCHRSRFQPHVSGCRGFPLAASSDCTDLVIMAVILCLCAARTAAKRPVLMLLFGLHLKVSWSFLLFLLQTSPTAV